MRVEITKRAQREVNRLGRWWLEKRDKAPSLFEEELGSTYQLIATDPAAGATASVDVSPKTHVGVMDLGVAIGIEVAGLVKC